LKRIHSQVFSNAELAITIPSTILFVADSATPKSTQISLSDPDSCPEFDRWQKLRRLGISLAFRRIVKSNPNALALADFEEVSDKLYRRRIDSALFFVKSHVTIQHDSFRHPLIATPIGFFFPELKSVRPWADGGSLAEVLADPPSWWTPTEKAKTVVGMAFALRFAHSFGLLHGGLKASNVLFDANHRVQIVDFSVTQTDAGGFLGDDWRPIPDVAAFASLVSKIIVGQVPGFVSEIIEGGKASLANRRRSFIDIIDTMARNLFRMGAGVDSQEVSRFVRWIEMGEESGEWA
jgi:serine/threonine protein kinase